MEENKHLGFGVMLRMLGGNEETVNAFLRGKGKRITKLNLGKDNALHFEFEDGYKMKMFDDGQSCCEARYMRTDDDLSEFVGTVLTSAEIRDAPNVPDEYGEHEVQFLLVHTDKGTFTMSSHNEHNGYYGGFYIVVEEEQPSFLEKWRKLVGEDNEV